VRLAAEAAWRSRACCTSPPARPRRSARGCRRTPAGPPASPRPVRPGAPSRPARSRPARTRGARQAQSICASLLTSITDRHGGRTGGQTTPTDSRSRRIRASRKGGQLLTRARSPSNKTGLPDRVCSRMPLSRTVAPYSPARTAKPSRWSGVTGGICALSYGILSLVAGFVRLRSRRVVAGIEAQIRIGRHAQHPTSIGVRWLGQRRHHRAFLDQPIDGPAAQRLVLAGVRARVKPVVELQLRQPPWPWMPA